MLGSPSASGHSLHNISASLRTLLPSTLTGKSTKTVRSSYHRAHGKGETIAIRIPFGCAVYFIPADTKGLPKGKFEGSGEAGVIAGYNMSPGYVWDGEYLCWSPKELANIDMMAKASKHPPGLQSPRVTKKIRLPSGNICHFPLKGKYDRQFRTIGGTDEIQNAVQSDNNVDKHLVCPGEHVDMDIPDIVPIAAESSSSTITPPQLGVLNRLDVHLGIGYEFDSEGHLCRRDVINRFYRVDGYGKRTTNRTTTCPPFLDSDTWRKTFTPKDRIQWHADMKAREAAEAKAKEESASSSTGIDEVALRATPASFAVQKERRTNPVPETKRLGIAGLFSDENGVYVYNESDSEASTSGAAPASMVESEEEDVPPWEYLENELEVENSICAAARESFQKRDDEIPAMPCW